MAKIVITEKNGMFTVKTPYSAEVVAAMRQVPGRRWNAAEKTNSFPVAQKKVVNDLLSRFFAGEVASGPKGEFVVGYTPSASLPVVQDEADYQSRSCEALDGEPCPYTNSCDNCVNTPFNEYRGPQPGTYAFTARMMVEGGFMSGDEADRWKDEMKDGVY